MKLFATAFATGKESLLSFLFGFFLLLLSSPFLFSQSSFNVQLGEGTLTTSASEASPINISFSSLKSQWVYRQNEISTEGVPHHITRIGLYINTSPVNPLQGFSIRMGHTQASNSADHDDGLLTLVYHAESYMPESGDFDMITLDVPFFWNGEDNLIIEMCFESVVSASNSGTIRYYAEANGFRFVRSNTLNTCQEPTTTTSTRKPQAMLVLQEIFTHDAAITGIQNPQLPFAAGQQTVQAQLSNFGSATLTSSTINWSVNGDVQTPVSWTGSITTGNTQTVDLGTFDFDFDEIYDITVWTSLPNGETDQLTANDSYTTTGLRPSMSGIYTIGGSNPDFDDFQAAISTLNHRGVAGEVIFNIRPGLYNEQLIVGSVTGASAQNRIIFQSETGVNTDVELTFQPSSSSNYIVLMDAAHHYTFRNLHFQAGGSGNNNRNIAIGAGTRDIIIENSVFTLTPLLTGNGNALIHANASDFQDIQIINNRFEGGAYGFYSWTIWTTTSEGLVISGNEFIQQGNGAILINRMSGSKTISGNIITSEAAGYSALSISNSSGQITLEANRIHAPAGEEGIFFSNNSTTADNRHSTVNNFIHVGGNNTARGITLSSGNDRFHNIYHNNVLITGAHPENGVALFAGNNSINNNIVNNIFANTGGGQAVRYTTISGNTMNHNNLYTTGLVMAQLGSDHASDLEVWQNLTDQEGASVSLPPFYQSPDNLYAQQIELESAGTFVGVTMDIDGNPRDNQTPSIGANNIEPFANDAAIIAIVSPTSPFDSGSNDIVVNLRNNGTQPLTSLTVSWQVNQQPQTDFQWTGNLATGQEIEVNIGSFDFAINQPYDLTVWSSMPNGVEDEFNQNDTILAENLYAALNGVYTLGGSSPDFTTLQQLATNLNIGGVTGPATINIRQGSYNEQVTFRLFPGSSPENLVTIQSESQDSTSVNILFNTTTTADPSVITLEGSQNMQFKHLSITAIGTQFGRTLQMSHVGNIAFSGVIFTGVSTTGQSSWLYLVHASGSHNDLQFVGNRFVNGSYGIYLEPGSLSAGTLLQNNVFINQGRGGAYLQQQDSPEITANTFTGETTGSQWMGIELRQNTRGFTIRNNTFTATNGRMGIILNNNAVQEGFQGRVYNNFVQVQSTGTYSGIELTGTHRTLLAFNNVHLTGSNQPLSRALFSQWNNNNILLLNNIFANAAGGYAIRVESLSSFTQINYNNYFTTGANLGFLGGNIISLDDWQAATAQDQQSLDLDPLFVSDTDLHVQQAGLKGKGAPIAGIDTDIDGDPRDPDNPDIGADEFTLPDNDAALTELLSPASPFAAGEMEVTVNLNNNGGNNLSSVNIHWEVNEDTQETLQWTGSLAPAESLPVVLGSFLFEAGEVYSIKAWVSMPNEADDAFNENDTIMVTGLIPALAGEYTIGGESPDFGSFGAAVNALNNAGVLGEVTFLVRSGQYEEQVALSAISGAGPDSFVRFRAESGDSTDVVLRFNSTTSAGNYTVLFDGASYISFSNMTIQSENSLYGVAVRFLQSSHIELKNNVLQGVETTNTGTNRSVLYVWNTPFSGLIIENNRVLNGSYAMYVAGIANNPQGPVVISNNEIRDQYFRGLYLERLDNSLVHGNTITNDYPSVHNNFIPVEGSNLSKVDFTSNHIFGDRGSHAMDLRINATAGNPGLIANNFIHKGGSNESYGLRLSNSSHVNVYHNNIHITSTHDLSRAFFASAGNNLNVINNNFVNIGSGYAIFSSTANNIVNADYNNLFAPAGITGRIGTTNHLTLEDWQQTTGFDFNSLSVDPMFTTETDLHVSQIALKGAGTFVGVTEDFDGEQRSTTTPDIGADEFTPAAMDVAVVALESPKAPFPAGTNEVRAVIRNNGTQNLTSAFVSWKINGIPQGGASWTGNLQPEGEATILIGSFDFMINTEYNITVWSSLPNGQQDQLTLNDTLRVEGLYAALQGEFTIGGADPDFENFSEAIALLNQSGVAGPVVFNVREGIYDEQIMIEDFPGSGNESRVIFRSEAMDAESVTLQYAATQSLQNYVVRFSDAGYVTFEHLTLEATGTSFARVVEYEGNSRQISLENNIIRNNSTSSTSVNVALTYGANHPFNHLSFENNTFENGSSGVYLTSTSSVEGTLVYNNLFSGQHYIGTYLSGHNAPEVIGNSITTQSPQNSYVSIWLNAVSGAAVISQNRIYGDFNGMGISLISSSGNDSGRGLIANNFIQIGQDGNSRGINLSSANNHDIFYNNINLTSTSASGGFALHIQSSQQLDIHNNNLINSGGGVAYRISPTTVQFTSDHNNLFTTGSVLGIFNGDMANLSSWQAASGMDENSLSLDPQYESTEELYIAEPQLVGAGTPLARVTEDIDNTIRDPQAPTIGAHEWSLAGNDAAIMALVAPAVPFSDGVQEVKATLLNSGSDNLTQATLNWIVNDLEQAPVQWTGNLSPGGTAQVILGEFNFMVNTPYDITVFSSIPNGMEDERPQNDTLQVEGLYAGLSGDYTVGGDLPVFETLADAMQALHNGGLAGAVTMLVRAGIYTEPLVIEPIAGLSPENTLTFRSQSGNPDFTKVTIEGTSSEPYTVLLNNVQHVHFSDFTLENTGTSNGHTVQITGTSANISFNNMRFEGVQTTISSNPLALFRADGNSFGNIRVENSRFTRGSYGIYALGSTTNNNDRIELINNNFVDQHSRAIHLQAIRSPLVSGNTINATNATTNYYGIALVNSNEGARVSENRITGIEGGYGISVAGSTSAATRGNIVNNFVEIAGSNISQGISLTNSERFNVYFNTVRQGGTHTSNARAFNITGGSNNLVRNNIFTATQGGYAIYVNTPAAISSSDYNNFFVTGENLGYWGGDISGFQQWKVETGNDSNSWDLDPLFVALSSPVIAESALANAGISISTVTTDIDGNQRHPSNPSMGAREFQPLFALDMALVSWAAPQVPFTAGEEEVKVVVRNAGSEDVTSFTLTWWVNGVAQDPVEWTGNLPTAMTDTITLGIFAFETAIPYNILAQLGSPNGEQDENPANDILARNNLFAAFDGQYTVGGATADFTSLADAVLALQSGGVTGPVEFLINDGTYSGRYHIRPFEGMGEDNPVTFRSASGDPGSVTIFSNNNDAPNNHTFLLDGVSHVALKNLTIEARNTNFGTVILLDNGASNISLEDNVLQGINRVSASVDLSVVQIKGQSSQDIHLEGNTIRYGSFGLRAEGSGESGMVISGNHFTVQHLEGIRLTGLSAPVIDGNQIASTSASQAYRGVYLFATTNGGQITGNKFDQLAGRGIQLTNITGSTANRMLVANNFVHVGGNTSATGISLQTAAFVNVYHNSVNMTGGAGNRYGFYSTGGQSINLLNNIFSAPGGGMAIYVNTPSAITITDHNNYYTTGEMLGFWQGNRADLAAWQQATGRDGSSISVDPLFVTQSDLHVFRPELFQAGAPVTEVPTDIDGDPRDPESPCIGADEFTPLPNDIGITALVNPQSGCDLTGGQTITLTIQNFGTNSQTGFDISMIFGGDTITENVGTQVLQPFEMWDFSFASNVDMTERKDYHLAFYTSLDSDENALNDTLRANIIHRELPELLVSNDRVICEGQSTTITASGGTSYLWSTGVSTPSIIVSPNETQYFTVTAFNQAGCSAMDSVLVTVNPAPQQPVVTIEGNTEVCSGTGLTLSSDISENIIWSNGMTDASIEVFEAGNYFVTHFNEFGCETVSDTVVFNLFPIPQIVADPMGDICEDSELTLAVSHGESFLWSTGQEIQQISLFAQESETITVTVNDQNGCEYFLSYDLVVINPEVPAAVTNMLPANNSVGLSVPLELSWAPAAHATQYDVYLWLDGEEQPQTPFRQGLTNIRTSLTSSVTYGVPYHWKIVSRNQCHQTESPVQTFTLRNLPDLIVEQVNVGQTIFAGQSIDFSYTIKNIGLGTTGAQPWRDALYLSAKPYFDNTAIHMGEFPNQAYLNPGQSYTQNTSIFIPLDLLGQFYFYIKTDSRNDVLESDETNNIGVSDGEFATSILIPPLADLEAQSLNVVPTVFSGDTINVTWTVTNVGDTDAAGKIVNYYTLYVPPVTYYFNERIWIDRIYLSQSPDFEPVGITILRSDTVAFRRYAFGEEIISSSQYPLWNSTPDYLPPGESYTMTTPVVIPHQIQGTWYLHVLSNATEEFQEFSRNNNHVTSQPLEVILTPPADLIVQQVEVPETIVSGAEIEVSWTVLNQGASSPYPTENRLRDHIYFSQWQNFEAPKTRLKSVNRSIWNELNPGTGYTVTETITIPRGITGNYYIHLHTDAQNEIFEGPFDNNNFYSKAIFVEPGLYPDLALTSVNAPAEAIAGEQITINYTVANEGEAGAFALWSDRVFISANPEFNMAQSQVLGTFNRVSHLNPGESYFNQVQVTLPTNILGERYIHVRTDATQSIFEDGRLQNNMGTSNSIAVSESTPQQISDLAVTNVSTDADLLSGTQVNVSFTVTNQGPVETQGPVWSDRIFFNDQPSLQNASILRTINRNAILLPDESYNRFTNVTLPNGLDGNYYIIVVNDVTNRLYDTIRDNNTFILPVEINLAPFADLEVVSMEVPEEIFAGEQFYLHYQVQNVGEATVPTGYFDRVFLSSSPTLTPSSRNVGVKWKSAGLEPGESYSDSIGVTIPQFESGNFFIVLKTNANNSFYEHNSLDNNIMSVQRNILVPEPSDLIVDMIEMPENSLAGEDVSVLYQVTNVGANRAVGNLQDAVYFSPGQQLNVNADPILGFNQQHINLQPGESQIRTLDSKIPGVIPGEYFGIARTNITASIPEGNFENNTLAADQPTLVTIEELPLSQWVEKPLMRGDIVYFRVETEADMDMLITLESSEAVGNNEIYVAYGNVPNRVIYDFSHREINSTDLTVLVPTTLQGDYYLRLSTQSYFINPQTVQIRADLLPFQISSVSPSSVGQGRVTTMVTGAGFQPDAQVYLTDSNGEIVTYGSITQFKNSMEMQVRWQLADVPEGIYNVVVLRNDDELETLPNGLEVLPAIEMELAETMIRPTAIASTGSAFISVSYTNISNIDIPYALTTLSFFRETNLTQVATSGNSFSLGDLMRNLTDESDIPQSEISDYYDDGEMKTVNIVGRDLAPGESFSASLVFRNFPFAQFSYLTRHRAHESEVFLQMLASSIESERQWIIDNPDILNEPGSDALIPHLGSQVTYRDFIFSLLIEGGLVNPLDTVGMVYHCEPCSEAIENATDNFSPFYTYSPGSSPGLQVIERSHSFGPGESYLWDINRSKYWEGYSGWLGIAGGYPGWDLVRVFGTLSITATEDNPFTIYMRALSYDNIPKNLAGWHPAEDVCWEIAEADQITGFAPEKFVINSYYFEQYNQTHGGYFEMELDPSGTQLNLCFRAHVPGIGEDGVPGAPGAKCEPGSPGGKGGPGDWNTPPGRGGRGGDGGQCPEKEDKKEEKGLDNSGGPGGEGGETIGDAPGGEGGPGGRGGDAFPDEGDGAPGGPGGPGGKGKIGGPGGPGGPGGHGGKDGDGGDGGPGGPGGDTTDPNVGEGGPGGPGGPGGHPGGPKTPGDQPGDPGDGGDGGEGGNSSPDQPGPPGGPGGPPGPEFTPPPSDPFTPPGNPGNPGHGGPGGGGSTPGPQGPQGPPATEPCCETPPPPSDPGGSTITPPPPGAPSNPGAPPPPPPPPCCGPDNPPPPPSPPGGPGGGGGGPGDGGGCGQNQPVPGEECEDRFKIDKDVAKNCGNMMIACGPGFRGLIKLGCAFGPKACAAAATVAAARCAWNTIMCMNARDMAASNALNPNSDNPNCIPVLVACDPNDILGPDGYGDEKFVSVNDNLGYTIRFENDPELAEAPAQMVHITQQLNENINPLSFRLGSFGFADYVFHVPQNVFNYTTRIDLRDSLGLYLDVVAGLNITTNEVFWMMTSIDPATGTTPNDPFSGFLAVNDSTGIGEGFVTYTVKPRSTSNTGDIIFAEASIVFDINAPIITPEIFNTIDALPPASQMEPLDEMLSSALITLNWTAEDDEGGSGVRDFYVYVSEDGSSLERTFGPIAETSIVFTGVPGVEYGFAVRARDNVRNLEPLKDTPETTTMVDPDLEPFIAVNTPQLDDVFCIGSELSLEWVSFGVERVRVEITSDGEHYQELLADTLATLEVFNWFIPMDFEPGSTYMIRVVSLETDTLQAQSALFAISGLPVVDAEFGEGSYLCNDDTLLLTVEEIADYSYQWYFEEELQEDAIQAELEVSEPGTWSVHITNEARCTLILNTLVEQVENPEVTVTEGFEACLDAEPVTLSFGLPDGGEYSGTGVEDGQFDPSVSGEGSFYLVYTLENEWGCIAKDSVLVTVNVFDTEVTLELPAQVCVGSSPLTLEGGLPEGGVYSGPGVTDNVFDPAEAGVGEHVITYLFTDECGEAEVTATIEVLESTPEAVFETIADVCLDDAAFELSGGLPLGGEYSGTGVSDGMFDPSVAGVGSHEIIYTYTDECGTTNVSIVLTVLESDFEVSLAAFDPVCEDVEPFMLTGGYPSGGTYSGAGISENIFDPVAAGVGIHVITYVFEASCGGGETTATIEVYEGAPEAFFEAFADVCIDDAAFELITGTPAGGVYAGPGITDGMFDPQLAGSGTHELTYTLSNECGTSIATIQITVLEADFEVSLPNQGIVCEDADPVALTGGFPSGGTYAGTGVSNGMFDPSVAGVGVHQITYTFTASCGDGEATATIEVLESTPQATLELFADVCAGSAPFELTGGLPAGGIFSGPGVVNGMFDPLAAGAGTHEIMYTYTDECGLTEAVTTVTVFESVPELVLSDAVLYLDENGMATLTVEMVDAGSFDVCTDFVLTLDNELFTCSDLGENVVEVTAINEFGQSASASVVVTVLDDIAPVVITRDIVVQLDENGTVTITAEDIDDGSFDNCEIAELTLDQYTFDQSYLGMNIVTLTVTDSSGNSNSETAEVLVESSTSVIIITEEIGFKVYPNPFNQSIYFEFRPTESTHARLELFDVNGALISEIFTGEVISGQHYRIQFNAERISAGILIYRLKMEDQLIIGRLVKTE